MRLANAPIVLVAKSDEQEIIHVLYNRTQKIRVTLITNRGITVRIDFLVPAGNADGADAMRVEIPAGLQSRINTNANQ